MANSPLDFFRRHKVLVMGIMLLAMVLFIIGSSLDQVISGLGFGRQDQGNAVVFTWTGGEVTEQELAQMRQAHKICAEFVQGIMQATIKKEAKPHGMPIQMRADEDSIVETLLLAEKARKMGVVIDDAALKTYLADLSGYALSDTEINEIADQATQRQFSTKRLLDQLRHELLAQHARVLLTSDFRTQPISLGEAWDYHNRLYRRVSVEAYPISVDDYLDKVSGSPTEAEKLKMFDKFKLNDPDPESSDPGFYRPGKMAFDYLKIDFAPFLEKAQKEITEEQIKAEYDLRVSRGEYKVPVKQDEKTDETKPVEGEKAAEGDKPADDKPAENPPSETEKPAAEQPAEPKPCFADEPTAEGVEDNPAAATEETTPPATPAPTEPATPAPAQPTDPAQPAAPDLTPPTPPATDAPAVGEVPAAPAAVPPAAKEPEMRVQTLDEVREDVRRSLAQPIANDARNKAVEGLVAEVTAYGEKYQNYLDAQQGGVENDKPAPLDVKALGTKFGFVPQSTPLVNRYEVADSELGKDGVFYLPREMIQSVEDFRPIPFGRYVYSFHSPLYEPRRAESQSNPQDIEYIFWTTETTEAEQGKFEDKEVQDAILAAWKKEQAVKLAKAAAEELAKKAEGKASLKEVVPQADQVVAPPPFSWFTAGALPFGSQRPQRSSVVGIELAGDDFLQPACTAGQGEVVVGVNSPHSKVYAIKVLSQEPTDEVLRNQFLQSGITPAIKQLSQETMTQDYIAKMREIVEEFDLNWNRVPGAGDRT